ncbi:MAG TPA: molybdenum cofactor biosynthesis protein MoaE [Longimicrobiales bacterium]|nr:molybdenum cofactor biosynthesis protein MoaE [Longimicrobiales bacterium]
MGLARITHRPIRPEILLETVSGEENGAALLFLGVVRDHADGREVSGMRYEAYEPMALRVLEAIVEEAEAAFDVSAVAAVHRIGELTLGEASLGIAVSSPHRDAAYAASRHVLEEIKKRVPVWKHEHFTDGASAWVAGTPLEHA